MNEPYINKIKNGNEAAFKQLFYEVYPKLINIASRFVSIEDAKDLVLEVLEDLWDNKECVTGITNLNSYLFKCIQNKCINHIRRRTLADDYSSQLKIAEARRLFMAENTDVNDVFQKITREELIGRIEKAIEKLPPKCREVFRLHYIEDMDRKKIATQMHTSVRTVEWHIQHGLKILRRDLSDAFILLIMLKNII